MKKRVAILFSGQMRTNSLNSDYNNDNLILEELRKNFINTEFNNNYDYDVYFSVDSIDINKTKDFFGDHLKNIHITEQNWYMNPIESAVPEYSYFHNKYLKIDFQNCDNHAHALYQYYRMYCAYNLLKNYQKNNNVKYDYLVRIRPDIRLMQDITPLFNILETSNKINIIMEHEQLCILKYKLEDMFKLIEYYGVYTDEVFKQHGYNYKTVFRHYIKTEGDMLDDRVYRFCPERQFVEYLKTVIENNEMVFQEACIGITYPSYNLLYRGGGKYGYFNYNPNTEWIPYHNLEYINSYILTNNLLQ